MLAARYSEWMAPVMVETVPEPVAPSGEHLVDMAFAGLNPMDLGVRRGLPGLQPALPQVPGIEGAGWVDGRPVVVFGQGIGLRRGGTAAQRISAPPAALFDVPKGLSMEQAAVCGAGGATAMRLFELANAAAADVVLVLAGAGNIGAMATSLFAHAGVRVLGQTRSAAKSEIIAKAGGEPVVAADPQALAAALTAAPTVIIDPLGGPWLSAVVDLAPVHARILNYATIAGQATFDLQRFYRQCLTLRGYSGLGEPAEHARCIGLAMRAALEGRLQIEPLLQRFDLNDMDKAMQALERGAPGKIIIDLKAQKEIS